MPDLLIFRRLMVWTLLILAVLLLLRVNDLRGLAYANLVSIYLSKAASQIDSREFMTRQSLLWKLPPPTAMQIDQSLIAQLAQQASVLPRGSVLLQVLGRAMIWNGGYVQAATALKRAYAIEPENTTTAWLLGNAFWYANQKSEAQAAWRQSGIVSQHVYRFTQPAQRAFDEGNFEQASVLAKQILEIRPEDAYAYFLMGQSYEHLKRFDEAIAAYRQAGRIATDGSWFKGSSYAYMGNIYRTVLGQPRAALEAYTEAVKINPSDGWSWLTLGFMEQDMGQLDSAAHAFGQAVVTPECVPYAHWGLGRVAQQRGANDVAIRELEMARTAKPSDVNIRLDLGRAYAADQQLQRALAEYQAVLALDPSNQLALDQLKNLSNGDHQP